MLLTSSSDLDALVTEFIAPANTETLDAFFNAARQGKLLAGIVHAETSTYIRNLRPGPEANLVAASLIRIIANRRTALDDSALGPLAAQFLHTHYAASFSAYYHVGRNPQSFEIINSFAPVSPALEQRAKDIIDSLRLLDKLERGRQNLLKLLNGTSGQVLFGAFLALEPASHQLSELVNCAINVRDATDPEPIGVAFRQLQAHADAIESALDSAPTHYGRLILLKAIDSVRESAKRKLELKSPPASLTFAVSDRPQPLLEPGVTCLATITISNEGDAPANDVVLSVTSPTDIVTIGQESHRLGRMSPHTRQTVAVPITVNTPSVYVSLELSARWVNLDHSIAKSEGKGSLHAHEVHIDWEALEGSEPFAPYPVELKSELVGRDSELASLEIAFARRPLANLYVTGQRRVGKTSLIRVLQSQLRQGQSSVHIATVEAGEVLDGGNRSTIGSLGRKLAQRLIQSVDLQSEISVPDFEDSLAPLTEVVEQIFEWDSSLNVLFVIDEFDELPQESYRRDGPGDALFVPMRSLAQRPNVGWLLVGGEKMPFIRDEQAARLNTFREMSLDYLQLTESNSGLVLGFADLVRRPLPDGFNVDDTAVRAIFRESAGNPHFAKELCTAFFSRAVANRDAVISETEIDDAVAIAARERDVELFAHFWEDGIFGLDDERRRSELDRREFLMGLAVLLRAGTGATAERLRQATSDRGLAPRDSDRLRAEFVRRGILEDHGDVLAAHVPLFQRWLELEGIYKLPPKGIAEVMGREIADADRGLKVSAREIRTLVDRWKGFSYRGQRIGRENVEEWLDQFDLPRERRLAFRFLERLEVVDEAHVYKGLRSLQRVVAHDASLQLKKGQRLLDHIYVSAIGSQGSSGSAYAYSYRQANNIKAANIIPTTNLIERLLVNHDVSAVVLIDDFLGTGGTAIKAIEPIARRIDELRARRDVNWFLFAVSGLPGGAKKVTDSVAGSKLGLRVELSHPILDVDAPLGAASTVFTSDERQEFRTMLTKYGKRIGAKWPLGFGNAAAPIVLPDNCPNNAPPILWSDQGDWRPLFPRTPA
jgi:hypothetical protein